MSPPIRVSPDSGKTLDEWIALTKDKDKNFRMVAADVIGIIGPEAKTSIPALTDLLKDEDEQVHNIAAEALEKIKKKRCRNRNDLKRTADTPQTGDQVRSLAEENGKEPDRGENQQEEGRSPRVVRRRP